VFLTSNLARAKCCARSIQTSASSPPAAAIEPILTGKLRSIGMVAVRKRFSPEFINRVDSIITYQPLSTEALALILDQQIADLQNHVNTRLGERSFTLECRPRRASSCSITAQPGVRPRAS